MSAVRLRARVKPEQGLYLGTLNITRDTSKADRYACLGAAMCGCYRRVTLGKAKLVGTPKEFLDWLEATLPGVAETIEDFLCERRDEIVAHIRNGLLAHKVYKQALSLEQLTALLDSYNWEKFDLIVGILDDDFYDAYIKAATDAMKAVGVVADDTMLDQLDERGRDYAKQQSASLVGKRVLDSGEVIDNPNIAYSITDTTRDNLRGIITRGLEEGMSVDQLADAIEESTAFSEQRAETIARTELADSHTQGNLAGWEESTVVAGKESILGSEHGPDDVDECDDNANAGVIALDDVFPSGHTGPPYHPNCICALSPVLMDDL